MAERQRIAKKVYDESNMTVAFHFATGTDDKGATVFNPDGVVYSVLSLPENIRNRLALHGLGQKLGDGYADAAGDVDGAKAGVADLYSSLASGTWTEKGESTGGQFVADLIEATKRTREKHKMPVDMDAIASAIRESDAKEQRALAKKLDVVMKQIALERAKEKAKNPIDVRTSLDSLLN